LSSAGGSNPGAREKEPCSPAFGLEDDLIQRRHVFYISGYDPQGVLGYYRLFQRELHRFLRLWPVNAALSNLQIDDDRISARWQIKTTGANWHVETTYEFLRWDDIVARDMRRPIVILLLRILHFFIEYLLNGTTSRVFRASWRFGIFYLGSIFALVLSFVIPILFGWMTYSLGRDAVGASGPTSIGIGIVVGGAACFFFLYLCNRWSIIVLCNAWLWFQDWAHGRRPDYLARLDEFARRIIAMARAGDVDELLVIGHSGGGTTAIPVIARALEFDPDFARAGAPVTLFVLGSSLPVAALHPLAHDVREGIRRVALEPSLAWIECQARKDIINFQNCDMVRGIGVNAGPQQCNPLYWTIRFRDVVSPEFYHSLRWSFIRMHYQFIMANDQRAPYDYFMCICGPIPLLDWAKRPYKTLARFAPDTSCGLDVPRDEGGIPELIVGPLGSCRPGRRG
jgi:pimeloyl-ACP methyl ester carboxylesterase